MYILFDKINMPVILHKGKRPYYQWGQHGKRYYFNPLSQTSQLLAYNKSRRQGIAIKISESKR